MAAEVKAATYDIFLSTPSARRATRLFGALDNLDGISIHALREEGDMRERPALPHRPYFYPRPPRGGRPPASRRGLGCHAISIHALREEGDL